MFNTQPVIYPRYVPDYRITINGKELPLPVRSSVMSVLYQDGLQEADRVEIKLANANLRWLQSHIRGLGFRPPTGVSFGPAHAPIMGPEGVFDPRGLFDLDNTLSLAMGYASEPMSEMFLGDVTGIEADFPNGGMPTMTLVAHDYMHRLSGGKIARGFSLLPDAIIAMILSAENLLMPVIDPFVTGASAAIAAVNYFFKGTGTKQKGQTDFELMKEIADKYDADFWVDGNTLYLSRFMKDYAPSVNLKWGESLLDFSPRITTIGQVVGVAMKFTLREIPLDFVVTVGWDFDKESLTVSVVPGASAVATPSLAGPILTLIDQPIASPVDMTNSALKIAHELRTKLNNRLTGSGTAIGDPRIRAGAVIRLEGLGQDFSGDYRITNADHSIGSDGYRTHFKVRKEIIP